MNKADTQAYYHLWQLIHRNCYILAKPLRLVNTFSHDIAGS